MKTVSILLLFIIISLDLKAQNVEYSLEANPIYHSIITLHRNIDRNKAYEYSNIIARYSRAYKIDPFLVVSIARQESFLTLDSVRKEGPSKIIFNEEERKFYKVREATDFCMMQINKFNVINRGLDLDKLLNDPEYCIRQGFEILADFRHLESSDRYWWTRYNASNPVAREIYRNYVTSHYNVLLKSIPNLKSVKKSYTGSEKLHAGLFK